MRTRFAAMSTDSPATIQYRFHRRVAAQQRAHARLELGHRERLGQVIVGTEVEAVHAVLDRVARGEHEDADRGSAGAQSAQDLEAVDVGEPDVEHDEIVDLMAEERVGVLADCRVIDRVSRARQHAHEPFGKKPVVLDDEDAHGHYCSRHRPLPSFASRSASTNAAPDQG